MIIFDSITKTDTYVQLSRGNDETMIMPSSSVIYTDDESGYVSIKTTGSRKTIGLIPKSVYDA